MRKASKRTNAFAIKKFWDARAENEKLRPDATLRDMNLRFLEIEAVRESIAGRKTVVDIGCGNGFSTLAFAQVCKSGIVGVDVSTEMIKLAKKRFRLSGAPISQKADFVVASAFNLPFRELMFNAAITERCLNNIPTWTKQKQALKEISRILKRDGLFTMVEGIHERLKRLNALRKHFGLREIKSPWHDLNIRERKFRKYVSSYFRVISLRGFGIYYVISRLTYPLSIYPDEPKYDSGINNAARKVSSILSGLDDLSHELCIILKKR